MWLNEEKITEAAIRAYRKTLNRSTPRHVVIDDLFEPTQLAAVCAVLQEDFLWQTQKHTYSALYVKESTWMQTPSEQQFVQRDMWQRADERAAQAPQKVALDFLHFLRSDSFTALLSQIFRVHLTDLNVAKPEINCNYFRLASSDFVREHADDSPGREVCMLVYLNEHWQTSQGGELVFAGDNQTPIKIAPMYNRCVLFDPASLGSEHWVEQVSPSADNLALTYRYNITSWYWSE
jgi:SM-20-related protein